MRRWVLNVTGKQIRHFIYWYSGNFTDSSYHELMSKPSIVIKVNIERTLELMSKIIFDLRLIFMFLVYFLRNCAFIETIENLVNALNSFNCIVQILKMTNSIHVRCGRRLLTSINALLRRRTKPNRMYPRVYTKTNNSENWKQLVSKKQHPTKKCCHSNGLMYAIQSTKFECSCYTFPLLFLFRYCQFIRFSGPFILVGTQISIENYRK